MVMRPKYSTGGVSDRLGPALEKLSFWCGRPFVGSNSQHRQISLHDLAISPTVLRNTLIMYPSSPHVQSERHQLWFAEWVIDQYRWFPTANNGVCQFDTNCSDTTSLGVQYKWSYQNQSLREGTFTAQSGERPPQAVLTRMVLPIPDLCPTVRYSKWIRVCKLPKINHHAACVV